MWDSWMLATIHVARNQRYSAQKMTEKAYTNDRLMHREGGKLIQFKWHSYFVHFIVRFQLNPLKSRKTNQRNLKNFTISTLELDCEVQYIPAICEKIWKDMKRYEEIWRDMKYILYNGRKYVIFVTKVASIEYMTDNTPVLGPPSSSALFWARSHHRLQLVW